MPGDRPPFRADHVGSLLRPPALLAARRRFADGDLTAEQLVAAEDEAIAAAVAMQEAIGLSSATDGEFRRASWHMDFLYQLGGVVRTEGQIAIAFRNERETLTFTPSGLAVQGRIHLDHPIFASAFQSLASMVTTATPKLTIPSPSMVHYRGGRAAIDAAIYPDLDGFWSDLAAAYRDEVAALGALGCTYLQFDDTSLAYLNDPAQRAYIAEQGGDPDHQHEIYIRTLNDAISGRPAAMSTTTHMCRGNYRSSWAAEGGYDFVAEALFGGLDVDGFFLEFDDARSGGFEPLRFVPDSKRVVLGLVTTKRGALESKDDLLRRIEAAARYVDVDQLCLSPQCGFSSTLEGNAITYDEQVAKLALVVEVAAEVWG